MDADLVVFPEPSLTDYLSEPDVESLARRMDSDELAELATAAGTTVVSVGFIEAGPSRMLLQFPGAPERRIVPSRPPEGKPSNLWEAR